MPCGACQKRRMVREAAKRDREMQKTTSKVPNDSNIFGNYKYLTDEQIKARLEVYKKDNCSNCSTKDTCNYDLYISCKVKK